ncbi:hypothetical protein AB0F11_19740 [Streptomyces sp. NPDC032472]|uniref:hypothetical protein n=1 Tax=Streptomyces sp. NPDC032472 TaxID=3155018 RepID=UPI0033D0E8FF
MPGHPVHPVQPAQPTQSAPHDDPYTDPRPRFTPASARPSVHPSVQSARRPHDDPAGDVVRWAAFSCLLVPVVLVVYGTSFGGAAVATLGLVAVTAVCREMLRRSERAARRAVAVPARHRLTPGRRRRHSRAPGGAGGGGRRGCRSSGGISPGD